jgi:hypothetical protein
VRDPGEVAAASIWPIFNEQLLDRLPAEGNTEILESVEGRDGAGSHGMHVETAAVGTVDLETERIVQWGPWRWHKSGLGLV